MGGSGGDDEKPLTPERWAKVVAIFEEAVLMPDAERPAFLAAACSDPDLRGEVDSLLRHAGDEAEVDVTASSAVAALVRALGQAVEPSDELVGASVGHFRIVALCGRGGMGVVYRAIDERLARTVALKLLPDEVAAEGERRRRFLREAQAAAMVNHPNIATVYEVGEVAGRMFIAIEYVNGKSLRALLAERRLALPEVLAIARQILAALEAAHAAGITHRDLKPDNVMITPEGVAKVLDFGLAKREDTQPTVDADTLTQMHHGRIRGTPSYLSPEQARNAVVDRRSDIFSFGVMFFEMTTGTRPFVGATIADIVSSVLRDEPPRASARNPEVSRELSAVISRCLAKEPGDRYASCAAVALALDGGGPTERASRSIPRRRYGVPMLAVAGAVAVVAVAVALGRGASSMPGSVTPGSVTPAPRSSNPRAARLYTEGFQAYREGRYDDATRLFGEAVVLDPDLAAAYLRSAVANRNVPASGRPSFRKALALRAALDPREQGMLDAMEPWFLRQPADAPESTRRLAALARRFPADGEIAWLYGVTDWGTLEEEIDRLVHALQIDPSFGGAWQKLAATRAYRGDFVASRRDLERCLTHVPSATMCLRERINQNTALGECQLIETDARRWLTIQPDSSEANVMLAVALQAQGSSAEAVRIAMRAALAQVSEPVRRRRLEQLEQALAIVSGDLGAAAAHGEIVLRLVDDSPFELDHAEAARAQAQLLVESGDPKAAATVGGAFLASRGAWESNPRSDDWSIEEDPTAVLLAIQRRAGALDAERADAARAARIAAWKQRIGSDPFINFLWVAQFAAAVETPDEARAAIAIREPYGPLPPYAPEPRSDVDGAIGRTLLLGGRAAEALPFLERAAKACYGLTFPIEHVRASFFLGEARAANGDVPGACAAYRRVLDRWGNAKPRAVTAERARLRAKELGCTVQ